MRVYQVLAHKLEAIRNCVKSENGEWKLRHEMEARNVIDNLMPHGSGIDGMVNLDTNGGGRFLTFHSSYHAMDDNGFYDRWIDFTVHVTPTLLGEPVVVVKGRFGKYADLKDDIADRFLSALCKEVDL